MYNRYRIVPERDIREGLMQAECTLQAKVSDKRRTNTFQEIFSSYNPSKWEGEQWDLNPRPLEPQSNPKGISHSFEMLEIPLSFQGKSLAEPFPWIPQESPTFPTRVPAIFPTVPEG
jgi:hypothetical protein